MGFKKSSIRRHLAAKIDDWLASITDDILVNEIKDEIIVTGGSITSMLLGEKINDYDIYFKSLGAAEAIAKYYVKEFNDRVGELPTAGTNPCNPAVMRKEIKNCKGITEERIVIYIKSAGVAAEAQETYRYFEGYHGDKAENFAESTAKTDEAQKKYRAVFMSQNAITLSDKIQLIIRFAGSPGIIHTNFDFVHATCWYDYGENKLVLPPEALECMLARNLIYNGSLYPVASIFRAKKFIERGWRISAGQLLKIMWQLGEINLKDMEVLQEQLTGVDQAYMYQLIEALKGVNPDKLNSAYIATIIDKIFE
jgi:hypothetical protein